jgi:hypothetical protein
MRISDDEDSLNDSGKLSQTLSDLGIKLKKDDIQEIARFGGDILKRTLGAGFTALKEVKDGLPKEASNLITKSSSDLLRGIPKEVLTGVLAHAIDRVFDIVRDHKLEISIRIKKIEEKGTNEPLKAHPSPKPKPTDKKTKRA